MVEVSPCKGCDHINEDKNKHPECISCIDNGVPLRYAKGVEDRQANDPEVVKSMVLNQDEYIKQVCHQNGISEAVLFKDKKNRSVSKVRRKITQGLREYFDLNDSQIAKVLGISQSAVWHIFKYKEYKEKIAKRAVKKKAEEPKKREGKIAERKKELIVSSVIDYVNVNIRPSPYKDVDVEMTVSVRVGEKVTSRSQVLHVDHFKSRFDRFMEIAIIELKNIVYAEKEKSNEQENIVLP